MTTQPNTFLGVSGECAEYQRARFAVLPIPYDATASFLPGTRHGPAAIIRASQEVEEFDEEFGATFEEQGIATLDALIPNLAGPAAMHEDIYRTARRVVADGKFLIGLGGEHSVTPGLVRAVAERHADLSVLQIDAHADLRNTYQGTPYSHACAMRRVRDHVATVVGVGIRSMSAEDRVSLTETRQCVITARECHRTGDWIARAIDALTDTVYVTVDIDGFDPAFAPGTGTPEPGGLDWYQVTDLLRSVCDRKQVVAADVVEVMPLPGSNVTEFLAARLAYKIMAYVAPRRVS